MTLGDGGLSPFVPHALPVPPGVTAPNRGRTRCRLVLAVGIGLSVLAGASQAGPLKSDELLLLYNAQDDSSKELASYYASVRHVPADRLLGIRVDPKKEEIASDPFDRLIRQPVRAHLERHRLREHVRCLVTFFGLPIRVGQRPISPEHQKWVDERKKEFIKALDELEQAIGEMEAIGQAKPKPPSPRMPTENDYQPLLQRYADTRNRVVALAAKAPRTPAGQAQRQEFARLLAVIEGVGGVVTLLRPSPESGADPQEQYQQAVQSLQAAQAQIKEILARGLDDPRRGEAYTMIRQGHGLIGLLSILESDLSLRRPDDTQAAVDSELMLLWWDDYPKYRWVLNTLNWRFRADPIVRQQMQGRWDWPVLLVARIDGPDARTARRMIDDALAAERKGLTGRVYIDAQDLKKDSGKGSYDHNLRDLAALLLKNTGLTVRLDDKPELFAPGQCPQAMLYCGWYSLRKYVDAFTFVPGAVAYHIASFEAISLKQPGEQGWCKRLLEDGVAATLGPVAEPYLQSFPPPRDFFGLLLTGRLTLVECYAYSLTFNSWMQMLLGDPLYRPFAKNPQLDLEQVYAEEQIPPEFRPATRPSTP